jgi:hypothetical protein
MVLMSFVLPGNARSLRFTGEAKAVPKVESPGAAALGKPRERKTATTPLPPPASRGRPAAPRELTNREIYGDPPGAAYNGGPIVRHKLESIDDGDPTMALDREAHSVPPNMLRTRNPGRANSAGPLTSAAPLSAGMMTVGPTGPPRPAPMRRDPLADGPRDQGHSHAMRGARGEASLRPPRVPHFPDPVLVEPDPTNDPSTVARHHTGAQRAAPLGAPYAIWIVAAVLAGILSYHVAPALVARLEAPRPAPTEAAP